MSVFSRALETYESNVNLAGRIAESRETLLPISHMAFKAQLEMTISQGGDFITASKVDMDNCSTVIPVTEASGGRSSGIAPHPLNDELSYIAGDFSTYSKTDFQKRHEAYMQNLEKWSLSEFSHPKVKAIYTYLSKGCVMKDLIAAGLVGLTKEGELDNKKIQKAEYKKALVRFRVINTQNPAETDATWEDSSLIQTYIQYYSSIQTGEEDICYVTGKKSVITTNHPKGVLAYKYGAKLISANDNVNFTYRGRFDKSTEACVVSYEASQKIHAALAWLCRNQGVQIGNKDKSTYICWKPSGKEIKVFKKNILPFKIQEDEELDEPQTMPQFKSKLKKAFQGYGRELGSDNGNIVIVGIDSATTGRASVTFYNELATSVFQENMFEWEDSCKWFFISKTGERVIRTPSVWQIVRSAYGIERGDFLEVDDKLLKKQVERLINCMVNKLPLPFDLVHALFVKASFPQSYSQWWNREGVLSTACTIIAKFYNDIAKEKSKGECIKMELDKELKNRSYQFGRLLAVMEKAEKHILYIVNC